MTLKGNYALCFALLGDRSEMAEIFNDYLIENIVECVGKIVKIGQYLSQLRQKLVVSFFSPPCIVYVA